MTKPFDVAMDAVHGMDVLQPSQSFLTDPRDMLLGHGKSFILLEQLSQTATTLPGLKVI